MKTYAVVLITGLLLSSLSCFAQDNCVFYFPTDENTVFEHTSYNRKGKVQGYSVHKVNAYEVNDGVTTITAENEQYDKKDNLVASGNYEVLCENNKFKFKIGEITTAAMGSEGMREMEMEMNADYISIPANPKVGDELDEGTLTMSVSGAGIPNMNTTVTLKNRKVVGKETITVPAGTFDCIKLDYETEVKTMMTIRTRTTEWYAKKVGVVRAEHYDKKGKIRGYTELTRLETRLETR